MRDIKFNDLLIKDLLKKYNKSDLDPLEIIVVTKRNTMKTHINHTFYLKRNDVLIDEIYSYKDDLSEEDTVYQMPEKGIKISYNTKQDYKVVYNIPKISVLFTIASEYDNFLKNLFRFCLENN